jgi:hypothetical protein
MIWRTIVISMALAMAFGANSAFADHNSKNGEGTANMPNDIHNTRVETLESGDQEAFRDFVKYGAGSESTNRFDSDDTTAQRAKQQDGKAEQAQSREKRTEGDRNTERVQEKQKARPDPGAASMSRQGARMRRENSARVERQTSTRQRDSKRSRRR